MSTSLPTAQPTSQQITRIGVVAKRGLRAASDHLDRLGAWLRNPDIANLLVVVGVAVAALVLTWALRRWSKRRASS